MSASGAIPQLLFWGDVGFDVYRGPAGESVRAGGCALNAAVAARRAGAASVGVAGAVGADGAPLRAHLRRWGVDDLLETDPELPTPRQTITLAADGERSLCGYAGGALASPPSERVLAAVAAAGVVHLPVFDLTLPWAEEALARRAGRPLGLDLMDLADVDEAFVARAVAEATLVTAGLHPERDAAAIERIAAAARAPGAATAIVTLGAAGARAFSGGAEHTVAAAPVPGGVVDTTGCGDAFAGAFLARRLLGDDLSAALRRAAEGAAAVAAHFGAVDLESLPRRSALNAGRLRASLGASGF